MYHNTLSIAICDDEQMQRQTLEEMIRLSHLQAQTECFSDADHFLEQFYPGKYDLILMDIYMTGLSGIEAAEKIRQSDPDVPLAFITTSTEHALDGYRFHVNRYLLKPLKQNDINEVLQYAEHEKKLQPGVNVRAGGKDILVPYRHIRYVEQSGRNLLFYLTGGETAEMNGKLDELELNVSQPPFLRCHKSFLVNMNYVRTLDMDLNVFEMEEGGNVYIRRSSLSKANAAYRAFMFDKARRHT